MIKKIASMREQKISRMALRVTKGGWTICTEYCPVTNTVGGHCCRKENGHSAFHWTRLPEEP